MEVYTIVMDRIEEYTGLSPAAFFTIAALMVVVYKFVCSMFLGPEDFKKKTTQKPFVLGDVTEQELRGYDGSDRRKPILIAVRGQVYDVSSSRMFYGPGGSYAMFAGREISRALALLSFKPQDFTANLEGLDDSELATLEEWEFKFMEKYPKVGQIVPDKSRTEQSDNERKEH